jgi:hypothetical protein
MTNYVFQDARVSDLAYNDRFSVRDTPSVGRAVMRFVRFENVPTKFGTSTKIVANHAIRGQIEFWHNPHKMVRKVR